MSTKHGTRLRMVYKRPNVSVKVVDYKAYCRLMWIRRQRGKKVHVRYER